MAAEAEDLGLYLQCPHEALQCLHHAYCYDLQFVLLVIGSKEGKIESGIWINYSQQLRRAYGHVLTDLYLRGLRWAYEPGQPMPTDCQVENEIKANPKLKLDLHTWHQAIQIFKSIQNDVGYPLLPIKRFIPLVYSTWNAAKSGSDTISKLIAKSPYNIPCDFAGAQAIARMLEIATIVCFRASQIASANPDLSYPSLRHYRNAASHRSSHQTYLRDMMVRIEATMRPLPQSQDPQTITTGTTTGTPSTTSPGTVRITRLRSQIVNTFAAAPSIGKTPKKRAREMYDKTPLDPINLESVFCGEPIQACKRRRELYTGFPLFWVSNDHTGSLDFDKDRARAGAGSRGYCMLCGTATNIWC